VTNADGDLFFISIGTRRVEYVACTRNPDTAWMTQQARNLLMDLDDRNQRPRFLIHEHDTKFSRAFDGIFQSEAISIIRTPIRAPNANAYAERSVGSVCRECLDRLLIFGRRQLEQVLRVYARHFNQQRPHRALELRPPDHGSGPDHPPTPALHPHHVRRRDLLRGLLHEYETRHEIEFVHPTRSKRRGVRLAAGPPASRARCPMAPKRLRRRPRAQFLPAVSTATGLVSRPPAAWLGRVGGPPNRRVVIADEGVS
jgi:hypothetical protein